MSDTSQTLETQETKSGEVLASQTHTVYSRSSVSLHIIKYRASAFRLLLHVLVAGTTLCSPEGQEPVLRSEGWEVAN